MSGFINQTLIFIGASVLMVPIFHRLGFGSVLGYLMGGLIVGPHALGLIQDSESILHFAELGVVLLLFIIGLEIQPRKLWSMRGELIGLGLVQVLLCSAIFGTIGHFAGLDWTTSLVLGFALSLSSTAFALQTLMEKNQFNTPFGRASFAVLLTQDLIAIPALALIPILAAKSQTEAPPANFVAFLLILVGLVLAGRFLMRPIFRLIASTRTREIFTAITLFVVFGVASLMLKIGLSAALGTFIAGVLLADSEYRHELEADLNPFKSLLMGLFFMAVGMSVSLPLIQAKPLVIVGLSLGYISLKMLLIYGTGRLARMSHENAKLMSINIGQGGEFAFVIFSMVLTTGLADNSIIDTLTAMITLSMAMTPLIGLLHEKLLSKRIQTSPVFDEIKNETPEVIIAGFGRFGQIFGRFLRSQQIPFVAIDHDADQIEMLRKFGNKVYYGDASRADILEASGAKNAKYFILAIDDMELSLKTAEVIKEHFPQLKIFGRARNRGHAFDLMDLGVTRIKRETFDASLNFVGDLLLEMKWEPARVKKVIERFRTHDETMLQEQYKVRSDDKMFVSVSQQAQAQLASVLDQDETQSYIAR
ncbi:MAG: monovalent cation:proton antiporter-2 (CPA2) family protein [Bacteriovoracia bacterium]